MEQNKPKLAAAITAAVMSYIRAQEIAAEPLVALAAVNSFTQQSLYSASGRQQMMEMRRLLSLRMGRR